MRKMKDSGVEWIGEIPEDWNQIILKYYCSIINGFAFKSELFSNSEGFPLIRIRDITAGRTETFFTGDFDKQYIVTEGDLLVGMDGDFNVRLWKSSNALLNQRCCKIEVNDKLSKTFLFYCLPYRLNWLNTLTYATTVKHLSSSGILNTQLYIPSISAQHLIADFLDKKCSQVDALITNVQTQIEKLKAYKQSLITEAVTKGLDPTVPMKDSGVEWIGEIPAAWEILKFKYIATVKSNLVEPSQYLGYPQISPENIEKGSGRLLPCRTVEEVGVESNNHLFYQGQIIYSKVRPILNKVTIAPFDGLCSADMYPIETLINKKYLVYLILSNVFLTQVKLVTENRVKMPKINQEEISRIIVCCPTSKEQEDIAVFLDNKCDQIDRLISIKQSKIEKLEQYKKSLIYEYVTGKKEVI